MSTVAPEADAAVEPEFPEHIGEIEQGYKCQSCEAITDMEPETPLYECGQCGTTFSGDEGNRCPDCNKFAARSEEGNACDSCSEGACEEIEVRHCDKCDTHFEVGDEDDHEHDEDDEEADDSEPEVDATGAPTGGTRKDRERRGQWPVPVLVAKPIEEVVVGETIADPWTPETPGAANALKGESAPFRYIEAKTLRRDTYNGEPHVAVGEHGVMHTWPRGTVVHVVTGWERPPSATEIAARDLSMNHMILDPADWDFRTMVSEVRWNFADDTVTVTTGYGRAADRPKRTYAGDDVVTVVDKGKPTLFSRKVMWEVVLSEPLPREWLRGLDAPSRRNDDYATVTQPIEAAMKAAGIDPDSRKVYWQVEGSHRREATAYLGIVNKQRALADKAIEVFRAHGREVVALVQTSVD